VNSRQEGVLAAILIPQRWRRAAKGRCRAKQIPVDSLGHRRLRTGRLTWSEQWLREIAARFTDTEENDVTGGHIVGSAHRQGYKGVGMEGPIARWYATSTGKDQKRHEEQARQVTELLADGGEILEVAPGPGYMSIALAKTGDYTVTGLDISETFVEISRKNAAEAGVWVDFQHGNASAMPFDGDSFDFVVCCAAFKNFSEPVRALQEMRRVLRPGGRALIVDLRPDVSKQAVNDEVAGMGLGAVSGAFTRVVLRYGLTRRAYTKKQFEDFVSQAGFRSVDTRQTRMSLEVEMRK
jgi:ubiquinone/menaquinone biosynthesis C-methylase UbiE